MGELDEIRDMLEEAQDMLMHLYAEQGDQLEDMIYGTYQRFMEAGFSDKQAFTLVNTMVGNMHGGFS